MVKSGLKVRYPQVVVRSVRCLVLAASGRLTFPSNPAPQSLHLIALAHSLFCCSTSR